jgi:hypothetical protein
MNTIPSTPQAYSPQTAAARRALADLVSEGHAAQRPDGSWNGSVHDTIRQLYARWLLDPRLDPPAVQGLDWLLETYRPPMQQVNNDGSRYDHLFFDMGRGDAARLRAMRGAPFGDGCSGFVKTGAALFLALGYGYGHQRVEHAFGTLEQIPARRRGWWCSASCGANIFQAFALHPEHGRGPAMAQALAYLAERQDENGAWGGGLPFFYLFNALSRLSDAQAVRQFERALPRVRRARAADGSWGRSDRELKTFLVLDALERRGIEEN